MIAPPRSWDPRVLLAGVVVVALLARLALIAPRVGRPADDPDNYLPLARSLAQGRGFAINGRPTAYRPPLYPWLLAPLIGPGAEGDRFTPAIAGLHLALGAGTVLLTMTAAKRWGLSPGRVAAAGLLVALDPVLVVQSRSVMTETLAAFLLSAAVAAAASSAMRGAAASGLAFGLAALCRPSTLPAPILAALFAATTGPGSWRLRVIRGSALLGTVGLALAPWAIRNARVFGEPIATTTHGGYTLALANNAAYYRDVLDGPPGAVWSGPNQRAWFVAISRETDRMSEPDADRHLRDSALDLMRSRPGDFARAALARLARFWGLAPSGSVYGAGLRFASALWTAPFWLAAAAGLLRRETWRWPRASAPAIVMALTSVHLFYWTDLRMRAPIVPALAILAASGAFSAPKKNLEKSGIAPSCAVQTGGIG